MRDQHLHSLGGWAIDPRLGARALGWLYLAGGAIGLVSLRLPHPVRADLAGLYANVGLALAAGTVLLVAAARARVWMLHVAIVAGSLLITRAVLLSGETVSFYSAWYIWVGLYAFYFFGRRAAAGHVALVAALYAVTLINDPPSSALARWLTTIATLAVAGGFIDALVRHARRQAGAAAASADSMARVTQFAHDLAAISDSRAARQALCEGAVRVTRARAATLWEPDGTGAGLRVTATTGAGAGISLRQPIVRDRQTVAVLELRFASAGALEHRTIEGLMNLLAVEVAVTLQRLALLGQLEAKARTDDLTGLPNRRAWDEQILHELARAARATTPLSVAMLDLDHFKLYNDTHGHQAGDRLLKEVAGTWSGELRATSLLARYGGEEFALALPQCSADQALAIVERLRACVPYGQSCSAGVVTWDSSETAGELLGRADQALYHAKRSGRNQSRLGRDVRSLSLQPR
ncbi:MAG TPA: GGDEF domain-containing protein [Solirubrobacteraceae bacterium]|nr:GGDEF domain-containing protein [Solirubrobacteraceae bacterium]